MNPNLKSFCKCLYFGSGGDTGDRTSGKSGRSAAVFASRGFYRLWTTAECGKRKTYMKNNLKRASRFNPWIV